MSGFLDDLELLGEEKQVPETIPGSGIKKVVSSEYMAKLPEHQSDDIDILPRGEGIRKQMEPGLERPVSRKKVQVQRIPGDGIKDTVSSEYMAKLPEEQKTDMNEAINTDELARTTKKLGKEMSIDAAKGIILGVGASVIADKIKGKKLDKKKLAKIAIASAIGGSIGGQINRPIQKKVHKIIDEKKEGAKSESIEYELDLLNGVVTISEETMNELMADYGYELSGQQIMQAIAEAVVKEGLPGNGIKDVESGNFMAKLPQYQSVEEAKPRKEDEMFTGKGQIVKAHDVSDADEIADDLSDDEALAEEVRVLPKKVQKQEFPGDGVKDVRPDKIGHKFAVDAEEPDEEDQQFVESLSLFTPIKLTENEVRIIARGDKYIISESDFESVCYTYEGELNGHQVLDLIAETYEIDADDIYIMMTESEVCASKNVKKALSTKGSSNPKAMMNKTEAKIARLQAQLKDTASGSATAKELRRKIKELRNSLK